eukprot:7749610-Pyramimonas_sp.AAC.1
MRLAVRVDKMDDGLAGIRESTPQQFCPANTIAFDLVIGISAQTSATGVAVQVDLARRSHRQIGDRLRAGLQLPGSRAQSSHLYGDRFLDAL